MPDTEDPIQNAVEDCAENLKAQFHATKPGFVSVHFVCGIPDSPGYIRRSAVRALNCKLAELSSRKPIGMDANVLHRRAMLEHVRAFDRKNTLFNLVARLSMKTGSDIFLRLNLAAKRQPRERALEIAVRQEADSRVFVITLARTLAQLLAPTEMSLNYLQAAYARAANPFSHPSDDPEDFSGHYARTRGEVFGGLLRDWPAEEVLNPMADLLVAGSAKEKLWNLLNPIQSTAVYAQGVDAEGGCFECACFRKEPMSGNNMAELSAESQPLVMVFGFHFKRRALETATIKIFGDKTLEGRIANYLQLRLTPHPDKLQRELRKRDEYTESQLTSLALEIKESVEPIVSLPTQKQRLATLTWWMCLLAHELYGRIHEGEPLDFWFVAGEPAEFADDAAFRLDKLLKDRDSLRAPFKEDGTIDELRLKAAVRYLEKEHFPWFHRGRHALLFDISDEQFRPIGLVEITNSSWHQVFDESYKSAAEQYLKLPGCAVVFVDGETHDGGLIRVNPLVEKGAQRIRRVMRLFQGRWQVIGSDKREIMLLGLVRAAMDNDEARSKEITEICLRVADDLTIGGTLVFADDLDHANGFLTLGESWTFGESLQDRIPLIAHDGATLLFSKRDGGVTKWEWRYRRLMTPSEIAPHVQDSIQKWSLDFMNGSPLNGVGARRWSAALTALREGVRLVVVISRDGGITCWRARRTGQEVTILEYYSLSLGGALETGKREITQEH